MRALEGAFNLVVHFRRALTEISPFLRLLEETVLVGSLCAPNHTGGSSGGVEACMGLVAFVGIAELTVDFGVGFWRVGSQFLKQVKIRI
jgi:hypothetical protein